VDNNKQFEEGVDAATDGQPSASNPYPEGSAEYESWNDGYHSIVDQDEDSEHSGIPENE
jgi:hypothetical protein